MSNNYNLKIKRHKTYVTSFSFFIEFEQILDENIVLKIIKVRKEKQCSFVSKKATKTDSEIPEKKMNISFVKINFIAVMYRFENDL